MRLNDLPRLGALGVGALGLTCLAAAAQAPAPAKAPALEAFARGFQVYGCAASGAAYAWVLKAPDAILHDAHEVEMGRHFAGPSWQAKDGSTVVGEAINVTPAPRKGAIAWLLLRAKSHDGAGVMADVSYIVRADTLGGIAPAKGCDAAHAGAEARVPYSATYLFFRG